MRVVIKDVQGVCEIKIGDTKIPNVVRYALSGDQESARITLVLEVPRRELSVQAVC